MLKKYFNWLQKDVPVGEVENYPEIDENGETSVKGVFVIGDLTGIPLLKFAAESGSKLIHYLLQDASFLKEKTENRAKDVYDLIIIGAGPSGISAGIEAAKYNLNYIILESAKKFNTIINFPEGKPIFAAPAGIEQKSELKIHDGVKESLLDELNAQIESRKLNIEEGISVEGIQRKKDHIVVTTKSKEYRTLRAVIAIGKSGNFRRLDVPGEDLPKVFNRLIDPADVSGKDVLVVGGGDTALETAIAIEPFANSTTLSYRKPEFTRPKQQNLDKIQQLAETGRVRLEFSTTVVSIGENSVTLKKDDGNLFTLKNSVVFAMTGRELPVSFFRRSNIKMSGDWNPILRLQFILLLAFAGMLYFGKSSADYFHYFGANTENIWELFRFITSSDFFLKLISLPYLLINDIAHANPESIPKYINAFAAFFSFVVFIILGMYLLIRFILDYRSKIQFNWQTFKYVYFIASGIFFLLVFLGERYFGLKILGKSQAFWYTAMYSLTIVIFGIRRSIIKPTKYIRLQTLTLIIIQVIPLFLLPEILLPYLGSINALGPKDGFLLTQVFPNESFWRAYGFILAWPLNLSNLYNGDITTFWLVFSLVQTFVFIPLIVYYWGKGAYCGWICSCGALAETLGDEYRTYAPHGPKAKKWENTGQWVLFFAFIITAMKLFSVLNDVTIPLINERISVTADFFHKLYYVGIDVIFAGVLGLGVYFFLSGRIWCRFGCPLAAWMHIVNRFSRYRIFAEKKKCISCNICTKVCHMGIDVMNYANKGIPLHDVECVRCSACIVNCPTQVLSFGSLPRLDPDNSYYKKPDGRYNVYNDWRSGL